jgi:hypothetical protein
VGFALKLGADERFMMEFYDIIMSTMSE